MSGRCFASKLSAELLDEMEAEIRRRNYAGSISLVEWCKERGVKVSKSSMARYCYLLREADGVRFSAGSMRGVIGRVK